MFNYAASICSSHQTRLDFCVIDLYYIKEAPEKCSTVMCSLCGLFKMTDLHHLLLLWETWDAKKCLRTILIHVQYLDFRFLEVVLEGGEDGRMEKGNCASHMFLFCTAASNLSPSIFYQRNRISFGNLQILRLEADWTFMILSHHLPLIQHEYEIWKMPAQAKTLAGHSINSSPIWN